MDEVPSGEHRPLNPAIARVVERTGEKTLRHAAHLWHSDPA
jgi:hypothetical protein